MVLLKNVISLIFLVALFGLPIAGGLTWWRATRDRWWYHLLFAPAIALFGLLLGVLTYYLSFNSEGQMSGGFAIAIIPLCAGLILTVVGYYIAVIVRTVRRTANLSSVESEP